MWSKTYSKRVKGIQVELIWKVMYGSHEFNMHGDELEIKTTMSIEGPLSFLWRKIVAEDVANSMPQQTENLIEKTRHT